MLVALLEFDLGATLHSGKSIFLSDMGSLLWAVEIHRHPKTGYLLDISSLMVPYFFERRDGIARHKRERCIEGRRS